MSEKKIPKNAPAKMKIDFAAKDPKQAAITEANGKTAMETLRERFLYLIEIWASDTHRYAWLEKRTGIPGPRWQNVILEKQLPTLEMLIAVCKHLPPYTYWLMHGKEPWKFPNEEALSSLAFASPTAEAWETYQAHRRWIKEHRKKRREPLEN